MMNRKKRNELKMFEREIMALTMGRCRHTPGWDRHLAVSPAKRSTHRIRVRRVRAISK